MRNLIQMPPVHRCAEAMWTHEDFRREMIKQPWYEHAAAWGLIVVVVGGCMWSLIRLIGLAVRLTSRFM